MQGEVSIRALQAENARLLAKLSDSRHHALAAEAECERLREELFYERRHHQQTLMDTAA